MSFIARRSRSLLRTPGTLGRRCNSTTAGPSTSPTQHILTLREVDRLVTSIERSSGTTYHPSPLAMRAHQIPWLSPTGASDNPWLTTHSPDLASDTTPRQKEGGGRGELDAAERAELERPKHMSESYTSFDLPLASDAQLYDRYVNTSGGFRMGKLLEHLDSLAGAVAYRHCLPAPTDPSKTPIDSTHAFHEASHRAGLYLATASVERLDMFGRLNRDNVRDLKFSGFVTWTGSSSMEVVVKLEGTRPATGTATGAQADQPDTDTLMLGRFTMVCRDSKTQKARKVPKLVVETEEEKVLWQLGEEHKRRRMETSLVALDKVPHKPSSEEARDLHQLMLEVVDRKVTEIDGEKLVPMKDTEMESVQLMFPQDRNLHGKVFGGILMRMAFELCFTNAALFASTPMRFLSLDQITFRLPVPIGAVLRLSSKVVHTTQAREGRHGEARVHIIVRAEVEEVETGLRRETNSFFFTLAKEDHSALGRRVIPQSYNEAMQYLEGKRRLEVGDEMRRLYQGVEGGVGV